MYFLSKFSLHRCKQGKWLRLGGYSSGLCLCTQLYLFKTAAAKWLRTRTPSEAKVASPAHSCHVSLYTVLCSKKLSFPMSALSAAHSFKALRFSVQDLEYICVWSNELPKLFSCLCPLWIHSQQRTYLQFLSKVNRFHLPFSVSFSKLEMSGITIADTVFAAGLPRIEALIQAGIWPAVFSAFSWGKEDVVSLMKGFRKEPTQPVLSYCWFVIWVKIASKWVGIYLA